MTLINYDTIYNDDLSNGRNFCESAQRSLNHFYRWGDPAALGKKGNFFLRTAYKLLRLAEILIQKANAKTARYFINGEEIAGPPTGFQQMCEAARRIESDKQRF